MSQKLTNRDFVIDYDLMNFVNETVKAAIEDEVQETVDKELLLMVNGESFKKQISGMIDAQLRSLIQETAIKTNGAGPGRGHRGRSHRKISVSLPETLYHRARELEGFFSCHVASALELYLRLQQKGESIFLNKYGSFLATGFSRFLKGILTVCVHGISSAAKGWRGSFTFSCSMFSVSSRNLTRNQESGADRMISLRGGSDAKEDSLLFLFFDIFSSLNGSALKGTRKVFELAG